MKKILVLFLIILTFQALKLQTNDCDCIGQQNCECNNRDIMYVMRTGQERLMFHLNSKEKEYIAQLDKQKTKHK